MGLFGNKKREAELQNEVTKLREEVEELRELKDAVPDDFKSAIELSKKAAEIVSDSNRRIEQAQRNCETEKSRFQEMKALYNKEIEHTKEQLNALNEQLQIAQESLDYIDIGIYAPAYEFESAEEYKSKLEEFKKQEKYMVKNETYASWNQRWVIDVDYREANKRAGYVYIISNIGAFGENIYKIGMTRRLEPMERVYELGDASVPFPFDVHALIFSEDAPALETALHNAFESKKLNKINHRREFFNVTLDEIKKVVRENFDKTVEWTDAPDAEQFRQSVAKSKQGM